MAKLLRDNNPTPLFLGLALLALIFNLFVVGFDMVLWDDDEAAYAGFALRMLETGDWVNPDFTWAEVHRKTPFHFWTIAVSYLIFGVNEFAVRFPAAVAVLGTVLMLRRWAAPISSPQIANWAAIILSSSFLVLAMGKMSLTDAWLMFFETAAMLSLLNFLKQPHWSWNLMFWSAIAFGVLVKGPPIIILSGGVWLGMAIFHPQGKRMIKLHPWFFGPISLLPFVLWCYWSYQRDGGLLLQFLYDWYVVERIGGVVFGQTGPPGYHLAVAIIAFLPWLPFFVGGMWQVLRRWRRTEQLPALGLLCWMIFGWLFYELMSSKLPSYAMGAHPAFALATAWAVVQHLERKSLPRWTVFVQTGLWVAFAIGLFLGFRSLIPFGDLVLAASIPMTFIAISYLFLPKASLPIGNWTWGVMAFLLIWWVPGDLLDESPAKSSPEFAIKMRRIADEASQEPQIALVGFSNRQLRMSFPFYIELQLSKPKEWTMDKALEELKKSKPLIILAGEDAIRQWTEQGHYPLKDYQLDSTTAWWSLNDQLKPHPLHIIHNLKQQKNE